LENGHSKNGLNIYRKSLSLKQYNIIQFISIGIFEHFTLTDKLGTLLENSAYIWAKGNAEENDNDSELSGSQLFREKRGVVDGFIFDLKIASHCLSKTKLQNHNKIVT